MYVKMNSRDGSNLVASMFSWINAIVVKQRIQNTMATISHTYPSNIVYAHNIKFKKISTPLASSQMRNHTSDNASKCLGIVFLFIFLIVKDEQ